MIKYKFLKGGFVTGFSTDGSKKAAKKTAFKAGDVIENVTFVKGVKQTNPMVGVADTADGISWVQGGFSYGMNVHDSKGDAVVEQIEKETVEQKDIVAQTTDTAKNIFSDYRVQIAAVVVITGIVLWALLKTKPIVKVS